MLNINPTFFQKQKQALKTLLDFTNGVSSVLYGGAAGGGKTRVGVSWLIICCLMFKGSRWLMGRAKLLALKQTTLKTFFEVCKDWGLKEGEHWKINGQTNTITFFNGSEIIMKDLFLYPSDPEFDSLGSLEITGYFIDEVPQVSKKAVDIVSSRVRYNLDKYCDKCGHDTRESEVLGVDENGEPDKWSCKGCGSVTQGLTPKGLLTCNPSNNWVYMTYYKPWKEGTLEKWRRFIESFVTDNRFISKHYIQNLDRLDEVSKARLRHGLWEYSDKLTMFDYDLIVEAMADKRTPLMVRYYMAVDVARLGKDNTVIMVMSKDMCVVEIQTYSKQRTTETVKKIKELQSKYNISIYDIMIDSDGVGGGVADHFEYAVSIVNGSRALNDQNYQNLKTQLYFKLAEKMNARLISFPVISDAVAEKLTQELQVLKRTKVEKDGKVSMTTKEDVKALIGRSPDYSDTIAYMMYPFLEEYEEGYVSF